MNPPSPEIRISQVSHAGCRKRLKPGASWSRSLSPGQRVHTVLTGSQITLKGRGAETLVATWTALDCPASHTSCPLFKPKPYARILKMDLAGVGRWVSLFLPLHNEVTWSKSHFFFFSLLVVSLIDLLRMGGCTQLRLSGLGQSTTRALT